jgi:hypothetical protein
MQDPFERAIAAARAEQAAAYPAEDQVSAGAAEARRQAEAAVASHLGSEAARAMPAVLDWFVKFGFDPSIAYIRPTRTRDITERPTTGMSKDGPLGWEPVSPRTETEFTWEIKRIPFWARVVRYHADDRLERDVYVPMGSPDDRSRPRLPANTLAELGRALLHRKPLPARGLTELSQLARERARKRRSPRQI